MGFLLIKMRKIHAHTHQNSCRFLGRRQASDKTHTHTDNNADSWVILSHTRSSHMGVKSNEVKKKCFWLVDFNKQHLPWLTRGEVAFKH